MMKFKETALIGPFENAKELSKADEPTMTMETSHYSHSAKNKQSDELAKKQLNLLVPTMLLCVKIHSSCKPRDLPSCPTPQPPFCPSNCF